MVWPLAQLTFPASSTFRPTIPLQVRTRRDATEQSTRLACGRGVAERAAASVGTRTESACARVTTGRLSGRGSRSVVEVCCAWAGHTVIGRDARPPFVLGVEHRRHAARVWTLALRAALAQVQFDRTWIVPVLGPALGHGLQPD
jgi:hypothetical protein